MRATISTTISTIPMDTPLCVKQLAAALDRHPSFVYCMRGSGFVMRWDATIRGEAATVNEARAWLKATGFRIINGYGVKRE